MKGTVAKGPTAEEFTKDVMQPIREQLREWEEEPDVQAILHQSGGWHFCFDHDSIHDAADLTLAGIPPSEICPCPPVSPDFQRVVERTHARMWARYRKLAMELPDDAPLTEHEQLLRDCFECVARAEVISYDVVTLPTLYRIVASSRETEVLPGVHGTAGDLPPKRFR